MLSTRFHLVGIALAAGMICVLSADSARAGGSVIYSEDFESLTLGPSVDEMLDLAPPCTESFEFSEGCWSPTGPAGWVVDNSRMPAGGVVEWRGWAWADPLWWATIAPDQERENFQFGNGFVTLIADSDEWDDDPHDPGIFDSTITSPAINITGVAANAAQLTFDSSWRTEPKQNGTIQATFDGGATWKTVLRWESQQELKQNDMDRDDDVDFDDIDDFVSGLNNPAAYEAQYYLAPGVLGDTDSDMDLDFDDIAGFVNVLTGATTPAMVANPNYKAETDGMDPPTVISNPETVNVALNNPGGATSVRLRINYTGNNNWWWAIDDLSVTGGYSQNWESVTLGPNVDEALQNELIEAGLDPDHFWTETPPTGWTVDDSGVPGAGGDPANDGVTEWAGWSFANKDLWILTAGDQNRSFFTKGQGTVAIADPDEWDDAAHPPFPNDGPSYYNALMETGDISLAGVAENSVEVTFDSSWRDEAFDDGTAETNSQTAVITVSYDGGAPIEILRWDSTSGSPFFHDDNENETVVLALSNPLGASNMRLEFGLLNAGNDWWWAFDNLVITGDVGSSLQAVPEPSSLVLAGVGLLGLAWGARRRRSA